MKQYKAVQTMNRWVKSKEDNRHGDMVQRCRGRFSGCCYSRESKLEPFDEASFQDQSYKAIHYS